ncbi:hypothetical protein RhiJN_26231 [Ceratobasidium sp. AG-Ba]|nr:hypothetical protein RhiJN_26231 [Ceratobasidium sp. AG-Ba]
MLQTLSQVADRLSQYASTVPSSSSSSTSSNSSRRQAHRSASPAPRPSQPAELKLSEFCQRVQDDRSYASAYVSSLTCYKDVTGIPHEFLVAHIRRLDMSDLWIRLERVAGFAHASGWLSRLFPVSSKYQPDDKVKITYEESGLFSQREGVTPKEKLIFNGQKLSLRSFAMLLSIFADESKVYTLRQKNCWFFCSVMMENLAGMSLNPIQVRNLSLGKNSRTEIRRKYLEQGFRCI